MGFTVALAPMAGYTDRSFRTICSRYGMDYSTTEMVSVKALFYGDEKSKRIMDISPQEAPVALQLFGDDADQFKEVIAKLAAEGALPYRAIDINMGCPAPKIVKTGSGSALLKDPERARKIIRAAVDASPLPVTVKIRKGFSEGGEEGLRIAKIAEEEGVSELTVHGRTREAYYSGRADWDFIEKIARALSIPVVGNGDIASATDVLRHEGAGISGVAIGRGAVGNPFLFREIRGALEKRSVDPVELEEILPLAKEHLRLSIEEKGEHLGVIEMRKHFIGYLKGISEAKRHRNHILSLDDPEEIVLYLDRIAEEASSIDR